MDMDSVPLLFHVLCLMAGFRLNLVHNPVYTHGDLDEDYPVTQNGEPCVSNITNFPSTFLFSVETQHTTGYGHYKISDQCPQAIIAMCSQSIVGILLEGICVGLIFMKVIRSKHRRATLIFCRNAVISQRDAKLCLMFRVGDVRSKSHLLNPRVRAQVIRKRTTEEGEVIEYDQEELQLKDKLDKRGNRAFLFWPTIISHNIDEESPLCGLKAVDLTLENEKFEIMVVLEGTVESTGLDVQARSSYLPAEIRWGHRFHNIHTTTKNFSGKRLLDYSLSSMKLTLCRIF